MTTPNKALLRQTLAHIKSHPQQWEQSAWVTLPEHRDDPSLGVAYDFATWAVVLAGYQITPDGNVPIQQLPADVVFRLDVAGFVFDSEADARRVAEIGDVAPLLLGIPPMDPDGGCHLFCACNDLGDLTRRVAELCGDTVETVAAP